jgi:HlyD family secretion protein
MAEQKQSKSQPKPRVAWWQWVVGLIVLGVVLFFAAPFVLPMIVGNPAQAQTAQPTAEEIITVTTGDIATTISASGGLVAQRQAELSLGQQGTVTAVHVQVGDVVAAGDPLVEIDRTELERNVRNAEQSLIIQENNLAELYTGATAEEIAAAQASLASAEAALNNAYQGASEAELTAARASLTSAEAALADLLDGPNTAEVTQALATLEKQEVAVQQAQAAYDQVRDRPDVGATTQARDLQQATIDYETAQAEYDQLMSGASAEEIAQAESSVATAQSNLDQLLNDPSKASSIASAESQVASAQSSLASLMSGSTAEQVASTEAQVEQARISLETAQANLEDAVLTAPFAGLVTAVNIVEGEQPSGAIISLMDLDSMEVVLTVDEVDLGSVEIGQEAFVTLETYRDTEIPATVVSIDPMSSAESGSAIATFDVHLKLGDTDRALRVGMTANAELITAQASGVLLVPNDAITADREAGTYTVNVYNGTAVEPREVEIGLRNGDMTEIVSGISEGDRLVTGDYVAGATSAEQVPAGGFFGGGGPPGGGGGGGGNGGGGGPIGN